MDTLLFLQHYWWFLISLLGALLVFLLFVQGGQGLLYTMGRTEAERAADRGYARPHRHIDVVEAIPHHKMGLRMARRHTFVNLPLLKARIRPRAVVCVDPSV